jgi:predicted metal-dependent peptidase
MATQAQQPAASSSGATNTPPSPTHGKQLTASELKAFEFKISKAKTQIVLGHPFWAVILLKRELLLTYAVPTAGINRRSQIMINPAWAKDFTVQQLMFLMCHEVGHEMFDHINRRNHRDAKRWNVAGDAVINDLLKQCQIGEFIEGGVDMPGSMDKTADKVYNELPEDDGSGGAGPGGIGQDIDDSGDPMTQEDIDQHTAQVQVELAQATQAAKMAGKLPGVLEKMVADLLAVKTPWQDILERHMVSYVRGEYTWARPNRRFMSAGHYLPSTGQVQSMGTIVLVVDVSGSVTKKEMAYYGGHFARIVELCSPEKVHVIYVDTQVQQHVEFNQGEEVSLQYDGCGGTHMPAAFDWCAKEGIDPDVMVFLTDGYTDFGEAPGYPVVWCISSDVDATHGETVHFEMED